MKKGCTIAIAIVLILAAVTIYLLYSRGLPLAQKWGSASIVYGTEIAIEDFTTKYGNPPTGESHSEIIEEVTGGNDDRRDFFPPDLSQTIIDGQIHDSYGNPLIIERTGKGIIRVFSTGEDGLANTEDDVNSDILPQEMKDELRSKFTSP